jgi:hypothetical protein
VFASLKEFAMSIKSHAFGRVTLTGQDAKKFQDQVTYGRASAAAKETVKRGVKLVRELRESGKVVLKVPASSGRVLGRTKSK